MLINDWDSATECCRFVKKDVILLRDGLQWQQFVVDPSNRRNGLELMASLVIGKEDREVLDGDGLAQQIPLQRISTEFTE